METNEKEITFKEITFSEFKEYLKKEEAYIIVEAKYVKDMTKEIKCLMKIGYEPIGGLCMKKGKYYQAMVI